MNAAGKDGCEGVVQKREATARTEMEFGKNGGGKGEGSGNSRYIQEHKTRSSSTPSHSAHF